MTQHPCHTQDHSSEQTLHVRFVGDLLPPDLLDDLAHQVEGELLELGAVVGVSHQVLDLGQAAADGAPDNITLVLFEGLKEKSQQFQTSNL